MCDVPGVLGSSTTCMDPRAVGPALASSRSPDLKTSPQGPATVACAVRPPALSETSSSSDSTATSELVASSWKAGVGGTVRVRREARIDTTSVAGEATSTVIVGVLRCEPRCSTGRVRTAIENVGLRGLDREGLLGVGGRDALPEQPVSVVELHGRSSFGSRTDAPVWPVHYVDADNNMVTNP